MSIIEHAPGAATLKASDRIIEILSKSEELEEVDMDTVVASHPEKGPVTIEELIGCFVYLHQEVDRQDHRSGRTR